MEDKAFVDALGSYITNYRKSFHPTMSAREFADKCEISRMVINDLESKKHSGNISSITLKKISKGLGFRDSFQLKEAIFNQTGSTFSEDDLKNVDAIIIRKNSNLYSIFEIAKNLSDINLEMLHSFAEKLIEK
ncbi:MAG: helix-turn-helix transcriptional regulator [Treponema sp.]|nr:helix-turn-helix transcriptional regulator [Clostridia bacterium]MBP3606999.1 helix-turn-helix transcriptional regulator [Treponema sp.]MBQ6687510.1 helix-turn-helix transcriptional regulator [Bacilli bacterium]